MLGHNAITRTSGSPIISRVFGGYPETKGEIFTGFDPAGEKGEIYTGFDPAEIEGEKFTGFEPDEIEGEIFTGFEPHEVEGEKFTGFGVDMFRSRTFNWRSI